jgi:hypothetical protein
MPPSTMQTMIATSASPPVRLPTQAAANRTSRSATPERSNTIPASTNTGSASSGYLAIPVHTLVGSVMMPSPLTAITSVPETPSATPSGTPRNSSRKNTPSRRIEPCASI